MSSSRERCMPWLGHSCTAVDSIPTRSGGRGREREREGEKVARACSGDFNKSCHRFGMQTSQEKCFNNKLLELRHSILTSLNKLHRGRKLGVLALERYEYLDHVFGQSKHWAGNALDFIEIIEKNLESNINNSPRLSNEIRRVQKRKIDKHHQ